MSRGSLLALVGPTASGKTQSAVRIAEELGAEIVSVDSMLVYRGMDVGTAKPTPAERERIRHHLIDVAEPSEAFSVARYQRLARDAVEEVRSRDHRVLACGGSGLYFRALVDDLEFPATDASARQHLEVEARTFGAERMYARLVALDPVAAAKIEPDNVRRTVRALEVAAVTGRPFSTYARAWERYPAERVRVAGVEVAGDALAARIRARVDRMLASGLLDEVGGLLERGLFGWLTASRAIGYAEFALHLRGELSLPEAVAGTVKRTKALARRQLSWFRRDPRVRWFATDERGAGAIVDELTGYLSDG